MPDTNILKDVSTIDFNAAALKKLAEKLEEWGLANFGFAPYEWQVRSALVILQRRQDQMVIARTGDGKSAVFQLLLATGKTLIVISPILGLIGEQVAALGKMGIKAAGVTAENLHNDKNMWRDIDRGQYTAVFLSPEMLLEPSSYFWHKMAANARNNTFLKILAEIFVDEAHVIHKWGETGFRKAIQKYRRLCVHICSWCRSCFYPPP